MFENIVVTIYYILFALSLIYGMYFAITGLFGFKNYHKSMFGKHKPKYKFGVIIAGRNEEKVIPALIKTIKEQNYPKDLFEIFVVPNNCTDDTEGVSRKAGATIINCTVPVKAKGDALEFTFAKLTKERKDLDAFIIFDADNLVHPDFLARMNDALCEGVEVAQCFRDSKNMSDNWLTGSYTIFYFMQNFFMNRAHMNYSASAAINGTGFMVKKNVVADGFHTVTLTEDSEFTGQCALRGIQVAFVEDAITYDEHPSNFVASWKQRKRWTSGTLSCLKVYGGKLLKNFFKTGNIANFDMFMLYAAPVVVVLGFFLMIALFIFHMLDIQLNDFFSYMYASGALFFILFYVLNVLLNIFVVKYNHKKVGDILSGIFLFTLFIATWIPINIICMIKKTDTWEQIKHDRANVNLDDLVSKK